MCSFTSDSQTHTRGRGSSKLNYSTVNSLTHLNSLYLSASSWKNLNTVLMSSSLLLCPPSDLATPLTSWDRWAWHSGTLGLTKTSEAASWTATERTSPDSRDSERIFKTGYEVHIRKITYTISCNFIYLDNGNWKMVEEVNILWQACGGLYMTL